MCFTMFLSGCANDLFNSDEDQLVQEKYDGVDERLWSYFADFEKEALSRGKVIDIRALKITGLVAEIAEPGVLGQCRYSTQRPREVTVDETFWKNSPKLYREFVVFHELGHCVLDRDHKEDMDHAGQCLSIMRSGLGNCSDGYSNRTRTYYIDELFGAI